MFNRKALLIALLGAAMAAVAFGASPARFNAAPEKYSFEMYLEDFDKVYSEEEHHFRRGVFENNMKAIHEVNNNPNKSWRAGINRFTDMTPAERKAYRGYSRQQRFTEYNGMMHTNVSSEALPTSLDWRKEGKCTDIKNQLACGSCWAFSTTEVVESAAAINSGKLVDLAPQQLVSCAPNPKHCGGTGGCEGSVQWVAMDYIASVKGMTDETHYPYTARDSTCDKIDLRHPKVAIDGPVRLPSNDKDAMLNALVNNGPIAISVAADKWFSYESGVFGADDATECGFEIDHAVVLEGYGVENGEEYYIVRNSWGTDWGEQGRIRVSKQDVCGVDKDPSSGSGCAGGPSTLKVCGVCGILSDSSYPKNARVL